LTENTPRLLPRQKGGAEKEGGFPNNIFQDRERKSSVKKKKSHLRDARQVRFMGNAPSNSENRSPQKTETVGFSKEFIN